MFMENLVCKIEALIFTSEAPMTVDEITMFFNKIEPAQVQESDVLSAISSIPEKFNTDSFSFGLLVDLLGCVLLFIALQSWLFLLLMKKEFSTS